MDWFMDKIGIPLVFILIVVGVPVLVVFIKTQEREREANAPTQVVEEITDNGRLIGRVIERDGKRYLLNAKGGILEVQK